MPRERRPTREDRRAAHWRRLGLLPEAPECVINAAYLHWIQLHHPDRGGSVETAQQLNAARDELRGRGSAANEHVAANYGGEPWHVLGLMANAERALVERAGKSLKTELSGFPKLAARVAWAVENFGAIPARVTPAAMAPPAARVTRTRRAPAPTGSAAPGRPEGLVDRIDLGTVDWQSGVSRELRLTWRQHAPFTVRADVGDAPLVVQVQESRALPGRFILSVGVDWESEMFAARDGRRGYTLDASVAVSWGGGGEAIVRVRGIIRYPAVVTVSPGSLDLGDVPLGADARGSIVLASSAPVDVTFEPSAWLARVDAGGRPLEGPLRLAADAPARVVFGVVWAPIRERGADAIAAGKPVRPTGRIVVRWPAGEIEVPVSMIARAAVRPARPTPQSRR